MNQFFPDAKKPMLFGHRGCSAHAPENTLEAFFLCVERGITGVELDVQICASGELVVIHDYSLSRLAGVDAQVADMTLEELQALDVGSHKDPAFQGAKIPTLEEVFEACGSSLYYDIELKAPKSLGTNGLEQSVLDCIHAYRLEDYCMVSSFNPFFVRRFKKLCKDSIPTAVIYSVDMGKPRILHHGFGAFIAHPTLLKPHWKQIQEKRSGNYELVTWTVDDREVCKNLLSLGVSGIISNDPETLKDIIDSFQQR